MPINVKKIESILQNFVSGTSDIQGATLVSPDGLSLAKVTNLDYSQFVLSMLIKQSQIKLLVFGYSKDVLLQLLKQTKIKVY
ncbi:hypothetical protein RIVM261_013730 [Rivularia sp. IAM M-261]|nr:hypothetical protein RIVM261_013730 [Rivularia sp. IAM M-261]